MRCNICPSIDCLMDERAKSEKTTRWLVTTPSVARMLWACCCKTDSVPWYSSKKLLLDVLSQCHLTERRRLSSTAQTHATICNLRDNVTLFDWPQGQALASWRTPHNVFLEKRSWDLALSVMGTVSFLGAESLVDGLEAWSLITTRCLLLVEGAAGVRFAQCSAYVAVANISRCHGKISSFDWASRQFVT